MHAIVHTPSRRVQPDTLPSTPLYRAAADYCRRRTLVEMLATRDAGESLMIPAIKAERASIDRLLETAFSEWRRGQ